MLAASLLVVFAVLGAICGALLGQTEGLPPRIAAAGGGLLFGASLFWMLPEMAEHSGWLVAVLALAAGTAILWGIDHFLYPICPSCSHTHDHHHCGQPPLHGFAPPLLIATGVHSILDGWGIKLFNDGSLQHLAIPLGLALHKIPEGFALGLITRESMRSTKRAIVSCVVAESFTFLGAALEPVADRLGAVRFGGTWATGILALIGGSFLFLGFHTVHESRQKPGVISTFLLAFSGVAAIAFVHWRP